MKKAIVQLESYLASATDSEKRFVNYLLNDLEEALKLDIHTLAKINYCSAATIVRVAKKNGYSGFKELKIALYQDLNYFNNKEIYKIDKLKEDKGRNVVEDICLNNIIAIEHTLDLIDNKTLATTVDLLKINTHVSLFGIGASFLVCKDLQMKLERVGINTSLFEDSHLALVHSSNATSNTLAFCFSYSGETKEVIKMAENVKMNQGTVISIVKYGDTSLARLSDYCFYVPSFEQEVRLAATSSRISQLNVIDVIYRSYLNDVYDIKIDKILTTSRLLKKG